MKHELAILLLWAISIFATAWWVSETGVFSRLAPVYAVCLIGSVLTVRNAKKNS